MDSRALAAITLASHANAALAARTPLRLPAHPAFMTVRRARLLVRDGSADVDAWFAEVQAGGGPVLLADAGVNGSDAGDGTGAGDGSDVGDDADAGLGHADGDSDGHRFGQSQSQGQGDSVIVTPTAGWRVGAVQGGVVLSPCEPVEVTLIELDAVTDLLRAAAIAAGKTAGDDAPRLWSETVHRAIAILDSQGTGEEVSDVAWPHFLLPVASPLGARRLAASAATLWLWDGPGAWTGTVAEQAHSPLRDAVADALIAAVDASS